MGIIEFFLVRKENKKLTKEIEALTNDFKTLHQLYEEKLAMRQSALDEIYNIPRSS